MDRALGKVPEVDKIYWDWRKQQGFVRFKPGQAPTEAALQEAITTGTMYSAGMVTFITKMEDLPDEVR